MGSKKSLELVTPVIGCSAKKKMGCEILVPHPSPQQHLTRATASQRISSSVTGVTAD
jgi:hypothetical protein